MKRCDHCRKRYYPTPDELPETHTCEECAELLNEPPDFEYEQHSDAEYSAS